MVSAVGVVLTLVGCGSSGGNWGVISAGETKGTRPVFIDNAAFGRPSSVEVEVKASPAVTVRASYSVLCGSVYNSTSQTLYVPPLHTPGTAVLTIPAGPPGACRINLLASKSGASDLTVTLLMRSTS